MDSETAELNAALAKAQGEFPPITRTKTAKAGTYSYTYASLDVILGACRPVLSKHGLALVQLLEGDGNGGVALRTELRHGGGGVVGSSFPFPQVPENPQQFGSMQTYFRRYAASAILGIAPEEDDDGHQAATSDPKPRKREPAKPKQVITPPDRYMQMSQILDELEQLDGPPEDAESWKAYTEKVAKQWYGATLGTLTGKQADTLIQAMEQHRHELLDRQAAIDADTDEIPF